MSTLAVEQRLTELWETPKGVYGWVDHKELVIRYLITAFLFLIVGGVEALIMRLQLMRTRLCSLRRCTTVSSRCMASQ
jgi:hypothetical protein